MESKDLLLSGSGDQRINVWSYKVGPHFLIDTITGHLESVCSIKFTPETDWLFSIDSAGVVFKWETHNFTALGKFWEFAGTEHPNCFDVSSDGKLIYAPDKKNPCWLRILDVSKIPVIESMQKNLMFSRSKEEPVLLKKHTGDIKAVKVVDKLRLIITAGKDNMILLWNLDKHYLTKPPMYDRHTNYVSCLQMIKDTGYLLTGGNDKLMNIFDISTNFNMYHGMNLDFRVRTIRASKDGLFVLSAGEKCQKVKIMSTQFLVSKLKKESFPRKKSIHSLDESKNEEKQFINDSLYLHRSKKCELENDPNMEKDSEKTISGRGSNLRIKSSRRFLSIFGKEDLRKSFHSANEKQSNLSIKKVITFSLKKATNKNHNALLERNFEELQELLERMDNPNDHINVKSLKYELTRKIEDIKSHLFLEALERFKDDSLKKFDQKERMKSICFHDYKKKRKTLKMNNIEDKIQIMSKKVKGGLTEGLLELDYFDLTHSLDIHQKDIIAEASIKHKIAEFSIQGEKSSYVYISKREKSQFTESEDQSKKKKEALLDYIGKMQEMLRNGDI